MRVGDIRICRLAGPTIILAAAVTVGCGSGPGGSAAASGPDWGPLAVVGSDTGDEALIVGTLRITETCAFLDAGGDQTVLVWHAARTRWNAEVSEIQFENHDRAAFALRDGDQVSFGGGGDSTEEGGVSPEDWIAKIAWVSPPDPACPLETRWFVNDVVLR